VARTIHAYDFEPHTGRVKNRRVFMKVSNEEGIPDGLTVDAEGFVWSAQWYGGCIVRYDPDGKQERRIQIPAKQVSSLTFGGESLTDLFVTSAGKSEPMPVMPTGYDPSTGLMGGQLFRIRLDIQGKAEYRAKL
jgi:sugar lactone lactonase YvrE